MNDRLYRSRSERMLAGVAGGVADRFDLDPSFVRIAWAILTILSGGIFLLIYIVMAIVVPDEPVGGPAGGWSAAGSAGWSANWSAPNSPITEPAAAPAAETPSTGSVDPVTGASATITGPSRADRAGHGSDHRAGFRRAGFRRAGRRRLDSTRAWRTERFGLAESARRARRPTRRAKGRARLWLGSPGHRRHRRRPDPRRARPVLPDPDLRSQVRSRPVLAGRPGRARRGPRHSIRRTPGGTTP